MVTAVRIHAHGGPEALQVEDVAPADPGPGEALVRNEAVGLNYFDTYQRTGLYPIDLPATLGSESAGTVEAVGDGVTEVKPGDRVACPEAPGAYAEAVVVAADRLVPLPDDIEARTAAASLMKALTVQALLGACYPVAAGDTIVFHAAAGGVGLIACQWAKALGARVIGTVGSDDKAELARAHGCDVVLVTPRDDVARRVRAETGGEGVPVVFDSIGRDSFRASLACLRRRGMLVSFGQSSGEVEPFRPGLLAQHGSLYMTRPTLGDYTATRDELLAGSARVFEMIRAGTVRVHIGQTYPLTETAQAHRDLESRKTMGATVLLP
jgi:NADPH2:quinone reductase